MPVGPGTPSKLKRRITTMKFRIFALTFLVLVLWLWSAADSASRLSLLNGGVRNSRQEATLMGPHIRSAEDPEFKAAVLEAFLHSWNGYRNFAWGSDELMPVSRGGSNWDWPVNRGEKGLGLTIVESLDTMWIMGLTKDFDESVRWLEKGLHYDRDMEVSVFETTIRHLGGLVSAYELSGRKILLDKAVDLANRLMPAFDTPTGIPHNYINLLTGSHRSRYGKSAAILAEFGSIQLEFRRLSQITGNNSYDAAVTKCIQLIRAKCNTTLCAKLYLPSTGETEGGPVGLGAFGDSYYEYLLKQWLQLGKSDRFYYDAWLDASKAIFDTTVYIGERYVVPASLSRTKSQGIQFEHLACFSGGLYALSYMHTYISSHLTLAEKIAETCHAMYMATRTKLSADIVTIYERPGIPPSSTATVHWIPFDAKFILRPETAETYFYLWRVTRETKYRQWGYDMLKAVNTSLRVPTGGFSGTTNVNGGREDLNDLMDSFWMAETLKYLYLLASEDAAFDLAKWVLTTEAHPLKIVQTSAASGSTP